MHHTPLVVAAVGLGVVLVSGDVASAQRLPAVAAVTDSATLVGTWRAVSIEADGNVSRAEDAAKIRVVNTGDGGWTVYADGKLVAKGTNELLPWSVPKGIDFVVAEDANGPVPESRRHAGIYELEAGTRRLCFAPPGADRPGAFAAPKGSGLVLVTLERVPD
jgi:uncharacterized protein (TIGR03067 family)